MTTYIKSINNQKLKICNTCLIEKPLSDFNKKKSSVDGHSPKCRSCQKAYHKKYYQKNREHIKKNTREWKKDNRSKVMKQAYERRMRYASDIIRCYSILNGGDGDKAEAGCVCCGIMCTPETFHRFDFHHVIPNIKEYEIGKVFTWASERRSDKWETLLRELDKCVLLCKFCHADHHYNETHDKDYKPGFYGIDDDAWRVR